MGKNKRLLKSITYKHSRKYPLRFRAVVRTTHLGQREEVFHDPSCYAADSVTTPPLPGLFIVLSVLIHLAHCYLKAHEVVSIYKSVNAIITLIFFREVISEFKTFSTQITLCASDFTIKLADMKVT